ncbi:MAG: proton-conducting transporter membrane subunit [Elusimicrobiota bacterium]
MILGIAIIWFLTGTFQMDKIQLVAASFMTPEKTGLINQAPTLSLIAFLCLAIASFAKAGAMPFHTWIPDMAATAPIPVTAYLPASLDKLLGIYLLARICLNLFTLNLNLNLVLMSIGAFTIVAAVFMAMIQHDMKKLLSYHAVSQVGYMVLGIGTGTPIGIAGGLFHMLNNVVYKSCLFLCAGSVEHKTGTTDLDKLGGLAKYMPLTFFAALIAAFSISGVPPFNGFFSKWMIYQGIVQMFQSSNVGMFAWIFLVAAMFGSALTLASFMKLLHATFLGQLSESWKVKKLESSNLATLQHSNILTEVSWTMWLPTVILAGLCIIFGIFAYQLPLKLFILPSLSPIPYPLSPVFSGVWHPGLATLLIIVGFVIGFMIYLISGTKFRVGETYIGGETLPAEVRVTGVDFYKTITDIGFFKTMYNSAEQKMFDIYDWGKKIVSSVGFVLSELHTGNFETYLSWCLVGMILLLVVLIK